MCANESPRPERRGGLEVEVVDGEVLLVLDGLPHPIQCGCLKAESAPRLRVTDSSANRLPGRKRSCAAGGGDHHPDSESPATPGGVVVDVLEVHGLDEAAKRQTQGPDNK